ncbi:MAG: prolyl oligopeptidase family serine peptidase [Deltaproteobacteria bacterium]|nr:prolyl oligopeptidase family serine peptidase [Deltaproteobacteria bacterium]
MFEKAAWLLILALAVACVSSPVGDDGRLLPGDHKRTLDHGGRARTYYLRVPPTVTSGVPLPVVFMFHGAAINAKWFKDVVELEDLADREGFVAVFPDGTGNVPFLHTWNAGNCCRYASENNVDDVGFTLALLEQLAALLRVDRNRVYAAGWSNGAMLAYRLACEHAEVFAAVGGVAGATGGSTCAPSRPMPVVHIHGTHDEFAPYAGGVGAKSRVNITHRGVESLMKMWRGLDGCAGEGVAEQLPDRDPGDGLRVRKTTWTECAGRRGDRPLRRGRRRPQLARPRHHARQQTRPRHPRHRRRRRALGILRKAQKNDH